jgi:hypothetical protein
MSTVDFTEAIMLYQYSNTAKLGQSGPKIIAKLWDLLKQNEIGYRKPKRSSVRGSFLAARASFDLRVNPAYVDGLPDGQRLAAVSLLMVHEGVHASLGISDDIMDELQARKQSVLYYQELSGPGVFNEFNDPPIPGRQGSGIVKLPADSFPVHMEMSEYLKREQLVDYLFDIKSYRNKFLKPKWIVDHLAIWGGINNRRPETKGRYIKRLAATYDPYFAAAILDIMMTVKTRADWDKMMSKAGSLNTIQLALESLTGNRTRGMQIYELQRKWGVALTERIPMR